ncbi:MAG: hypothetical protein IKT40_12055 [Bacilli bacterium]|nr:hypothetical protein [Bacilli bacterium]
MSWKKFNIKNVECECRTMSNFNGTSSTVVYVNEVYCGEIVDSSTDESSFKRKLEDHLKKNGLIDA